MATPKKSVKKPPGRASEYTDAMADKICVAIAEGNALHVLCQTPEYPSESTVYKWLNQNPHFAEKYARARERQAERGVDEMRVIADTATDASLARNQIDVRKWAASKLLPKKYGDRITVGGDAADPLTLLIGSVQGSSLEPPTRVLLPSGGDE